MNKQELIERIKKLPFSYIWDEPYLNKEVVLEAVEQLDEPEKSEIPQFVADWYEENKDDFEFNVWDWIAFRNEPEKLKNKEFNYWINDGEGNPIQTLANMHQFGYEVEKEKIYTVKVKAILGQYLGRYYLNNEELTPQFTRTQLTGKEKLPTFTHKELEEAGFGWVFDCEGIEIEEVE